MATKSATPSNDATVQEHCIDLPGETVQCWIGGDTDKLRVILRKHRDVIFDIRLENGKTYTLETTKSDFYNVRDKKLILAAQHEKVFFKDSERLHVWVSRGFRGALVLKQEERVIYEVSPNEWDRHRYSDDPKEKPAPILVAVGSHASSAAPPGKRVIREETKPPAPISAAAATVSEPPQGFLCPIVCVIDGHVEGMPAHIAEHFATGGDHSGLADIDPNHVATSNWIWGQAVGTGAYVKDNWEWLRASLDRNTSKGFQLVKAQVHYVRGKVRFYFSGYSNSNTMFGRGGFGPSHDRIMTIFSGAGKTSSTFNSMLKGVAGSFREFAMVSFVFGAVTAYAEWKNDVHKDGYDLAAALVTATVKAILTAAAVTLIVAAIIWFVMIAFGAAVSVVLVGAATIFVGFLANYAVEATDKSLGQVISDDRSNTDGTSSIIGSWMRKAGQQAQERIHENWAYLMQKMWRDYEEIKF